MKPMFICSEAVKKTQTNKVCILRSYFVSRFLKFPLLLFFDFEDFCFYQNWVLGNVKIYKPIMRKNFYMRTYALPSATRAFTKKSKYERTETAKFVDLETK